VNGQSRTVAQANPKDCLVAGSVASLLPSPKLEEIAEPKHYKANVAGENGRLGSWGITNALEIQGVV